MEVIILFLVLWYGGLFFQTFFLHRYSAHQTFTMSKAMEKITYIGTWLFQGSNYLSAYAYGVMHRMHHAYADTEKDPHSPKYDEHVFAMMWRTRSVYQNVLNKRIVVEDKFTTNVPHWVAFDKMASSPVSRILWTILYILFFVKFATTWWLWLFLPIIVLMAPIHGVIINWYAHTYGYVNFKVSDTSKNLLPVDVLMMGEAYHNNHHKHASRPNFGVKWFEIDPTYLIMRVLNKIRVIKLKATTK